LFSNDDKTSTITEDELLALVHLGAREGEITHEESKMVRNIIHLEEKNVTDIMTPRNMIISLEVNMPLKDIIPIIQSSGFSRLPVYETDRENIIGYALVKDIYAQHLNNEKNNSLKSIVYPINQIDNQSNCLKLLIQFLKNKKHIAVVMDEFSGVDGLVTLEDLLETVLGTEIVDETDRIIDLQEAARKKSGDIKSKSKGEKL
jgi:CBS domain containing-hemolysin-like protein